MRLAVFLLVFFLLASLTHSAYVYGDIYKLNNFEKLNSSVIKIDGRFSYQMVNKKTNYSIELPEGDYNISAEYYDENGNMVLYARQGVKLGGDNQRIDLILLPTGNTFEYILGAGAAIIALFIFYNVVIKNAHQNKPGQKEHTEPKATELDDDAKRVLQTLESSESRATQKEIKDALHFSDAKLSLILTELEQMGKIKKFKRGRGNIIRKL